MAKPSKPPPRKTQSQNPPARKARPSGVKARPEGLKAGASGFKARATKAGATGDTSGFGGQGRAGRPAFAGKGKATRNRADGGGDTRLDVRGGGGARRGFGGRAPDAPVAAASSEPMRIAKAMARAGLCSRREAERWIADGRVSVNGKLLKTPACEVGPKDKVIVDGKPLPMAEPAKLWRYHKPRGVVTTHSDPQGRPTVFEKLPPELERVISIGRLDFNTEGLLLLTNDGDLARHLELPATGWTRRYRVRAKGRITEQDLAAIKDGVEIDGVAYGPVEASVDSSQGANMWLTVAIREGKNREVRRILAYLGLEVNRLIRVSFGPFQLRDLETGAVEQVKRRVLAEQIGVELAQQLGLSESSEQRKARHERAKALTGKRSRDGDEDEA